MATANLSAQAQESNRLSTHPTTAKDGEGKERDVLVTVEKVDCESMPHCLRHISKWEALEDAAAITEFLKDFTYLMWSKNEDALQGRSARGMTVICQLLLDKIEIGQGSYPFPELAFGEDTPALVRREK